MSADTLAKREPSPDDAAGLNHYIVHGHYEGEPDDFTSYVQAPTVVEAEDAFKAHHAIRGLRRHVSEVFVTLIVQLGGPPVAIFTEDDVVENIKPITHGG